jgi:uncharacterized surface protein with fasciclin (FAS1) repeats
MDIVDTVERAGNFSLLLAALRAAGLDATLHGQGPYTIFAPTDEAFMKLPVGTLDLLLRPENRERLADVLSYHVVRGEITSEDAKQGDEFETVEGEPIRVWDDDGIKVNYARVIKADIDTDNGVIHAIDSVLMPE